MMKPEPDKLARIIEASLDDEDLAEEFQMFAEDHVSLNSEPEFLASVMALPTMMRRIFLVLSADISISGDGFPGYYEPTRPGKFYQDAAEGFRMAGEPELADIFTRGIDAMRGPLASSSVVELDEATGGIHKKYFARHRGLAEKVGALVRKLGVKLLA